MPIYFGNDNLITLSNLTDSATGEVLNSATVTAKILDAITGLQVGADIPMTYVAGSNGKYIGVIDDAHAVVLNTGYTVKIHAEASGGRIGDWNPNRRAIKRVS